MNLTGDVEVFGFGMGALCARSIYHSASSGFCRAPIIKSLTKTYHIPAFAALWCIIYAQVILLEVLTSCCEVHL